MSFQKDFLSKKITDPLAKIVSDLAKQEYQQTFQTQNIDTLNVNILSIKTKTKTLSKDKFHVSVKSYDPDQRFYNAVYPDRDKMKLWLKGENSDKLHDYSLTNHNAHLWSGVQVAEQYQREDPNNMAGHEIVSYANSTHYVHVQDREDLRISDLIVDEPSSDGFTIVVRFYPLIYGTSNQESVIIEQKVDSSQNRYGHSVNIDAVGNIYFYVTYNHRLYWCKVPKPIQIPTMFANFASENYKPENYKTEVGSLEDAIGISYDLVCEFNYTTKECIIKVLYNGEIIKEVSSINADPDAVPGLDPEYQLPAGAQLHLPLQEGKWSETQALPNNLPLNKVFDTSTNQFEGTINNPTATATWLEDNTLHNTRVNSGGTSISVPNHANLNVFTELTICFWAKFDNLTNDGTFRIFVSKGWSSNGAFVIYRELNNSNIVFAFKTDAGVTVARTFVNAITDTDWHFYSMRWKSGEKLKVSKDNATELESSTTGTGTLTQTAAVNILATSASENMSMLHFILYRRQLEPYEITRLYEYGAHLAQFPQNLEPQRLPNPSPPPTTNPIVTIYDLPKLVSPTIEDYTFINNPSTQNPFVEKYNVPDGVAGGVPITTIYNIAAGSGGTTVNPFTTIYTLPGASSTGNIDESGGEWAYGQQIQDNTSDMFGEKVTEIQCWLDENAATGGSLYLGIIKSNADPAVPTSYIKFGAAITLAELTGGWVSFTRQLLTNTYVMAVGDAVGVIWEGGTGGSILIRRGGSSHYEAGSRQNHADAEGWQNPNTSFSMAGTFKKGGDTVGTSPYYSLKNATGNNYVCGELFPTNSPMVGNIPTRVEFRVYRDTAANNGTVSIRHIKTDGTYWASLYEVNVSTLPDQTAIPTTFNFVWENLDYNRQILAGERIAVVTNGLTTGNVYVLSNIGNSAAGNSYDTTRSLLSYRNFNGTWGSNNAYDISGVIKKGGNTFTGLMRFTPSVTRIYERAVDTGSLIYDQPLSKIIARGKRVGTIPSPATITARLRSNANVEKAVLGTFDGNAVGTSIGDIPFINNNNEVKVAVGDYVSIEIGTCDASNYIELSISNVPYNAGNSIAGILNAGIIEDLASYDLSGKFYIGGQIDNVSRPRVSQYIDTQDSIFLTVPINRITIFEATLYAIGAPTGLIYINIRRGFDDALIFSLGSVSAGSITTSLTGTTIHIENFNNTYILGAKDKISIEYEGGDPLNKIGVQIRTVVPDYDGDNSYVARYNGVEYDYLPTKDLVATMKVGGDTFQPDPNAPPPVLPQNPTDLYLLSDIKKRQSSFLRCIFGMYIFWNTLLTDEELTQLNITRIDTGNNLPDEIQVTNHSFLRNSQLFFLTIL